MRRFGRGIMARPTHEKPYPPSGVERDAEIMLTFMNHARVMLDILAVGATARTWKEKYGEDLSPELLEGLSKLGALIDPQSHFQNQNYGNPEP